MTAERAVMCVEKVTYFGEFCHLSSSCIRKSITLIFMSSSRNRFTLLYQNSVSDVLLVSARHVGAHPGGYQRGVSIQISIHWTKKWIYSGSQITANV